MHRHFRFLVLSEVGSSVCRVRDLLFPSSPALTGSLRAGARVQAAGFVQECRAIARMYEAAAPEERDFVHGEVACVLRLRRRPPPDGPRPHWR